MSHDMVGGRRIKAKRGMKVKVVGGRPSRWHGREGFVLGIDEGSHKITIVWADAARFTDPAHMTFETYRKNISIVDRWGDYNEYGPVMRHLNAAKRGEAEAQTGIKDEVPAPVAEAEPVVLTPMQRHWPETVMNLASSKWDVLPEAIGDDIVVEFPNTNDAKSD